MLASITETARPAVFVYPEPPSAPAADAPNADAATATQRIVDAVTNGFFDAGGVTLLAETGEARHAWFVADLLRFFGDDDVAIEADDAPLAFQDTMSALGSEAGPAATGLRPYFFDVMFLDGASLIDRPLRERLEELHRLAPAHIVPQRFTDDPEIAEAHLAEALDRGHEGVMVKAADSVYEAGRRGKSWRKVKPVHTLDLVVLAAEWGHGRRRGWLSNLHLGARHPETGEFVMVGKTFKGLTDELLGWQTEQFLARALDDAGHTVYVRPELVVEIALDGAQASTRYPGGVALRFARVRGYRPDRDPGSADTLDAVRALLPGHRRPAGPDDAGNGRTPQH